MKNKKNYNPFVVYIQVITTRHKKNFTESFYSEIHVLLTLSLLTYSLRLSLM